MVLLQIGTTRLAGRVDAVKNENIPPRRKSAKRRGLHSVYYTVYILYILYSLLLAVALWPWAWPSWPWVCLYRRGHTL